MGLFNKLFGSNDKTVPKVKYSLVDYNRYFENSSIENMSLELLSLGSLNLGTGKIIACDPLVYFNDEPPFTRTVEPGIYPVIACIAKTENSGDRYAVVKLEFSKERPAKWEMAVVAQQDVTELTDDDFFGFGVDAGLGSFCDEETQKLYSRFHDEFYEKNPDANIYTDFFAAEFKKNAVEADDIGNWVNFYLPNNPNFNIIMFHSGYGDGLYPCYWGMNGEGKICSLIVDFQVF
ncbi:MAG: hypothetical protein JWP81_1218 [Ferruginibacter sp.]|nr:hypothetical protein [Ferruginibacter sp.]